MGARSRARKTRIIACMARGRRALTAGDRLPWRIVSSSLLSVTKLCTERRGSYALVVTTAHGLTVAGYIARYATMDTGIRLDS